MTAHAGNGHLKTSFEGQVTLLRYMTPSSLSPRTMNTVSPSNTVSLQVVKENIGDNEIRQNF